MRRIMTAIMSKPKRPSSITLISVFEIYGALMLFYFIFRPGIQNLDLGNTAFLAIAGIILLVCGIGFWFMKKWAVYAFAIFGIVAQIFSLVIGRWNFTPLLLTIIIVYIGYKHLSKMS